MYIYTHKFFRPGPGDLAIPRLNNNMALSRLPQKRCSKFIFNFFKNNNVNSTPKPFESNNGKRYAHFTYFPEPTPSASGMNFEMKMLIEGVLTLSIELNVML